MLKQDVSTCILFFMRPASQSMGVGRTAAGRSGEEREGGPRGSLPRDVDGVGERAVRRAERFSFFFPQMCGKFCEI